MESSHYAARIHKSVPTGLVSTKGVWPGSKGRPGPMRDKREGLGQTDRETEENRGKEWERAVVFQEVERLSSSVAGLARTSVAYLPQRHASASPPNVSAPCGT